jgi:hypothetical protein
LSPGRDLAAGPKTHCCGSGREVASNRVAHHPQVEHNADEAELVQNVDAVPFAAEDLDFEVTRTIDVTGQAVARIENLFANAIWKP